MRLRERVTSAIATHLAAFLMTPLLLGLAGCSGDTVATYEPTTDPTQLYLSLALNHRAITMAAVAPYDTLQLVATPFDGNGQPIPNLPAPIFTSSDTFSLKVGADGVLHALQPVSGVVVSAEVVAPGNVRHADTAIVNVTLPPPAMLDTLSMHPLSPDSTIWSIAPAQSDSLYVLPLYTLYFAGQFSNTSLQSYVRAIDAAHNPMPVGQGGLVFEYLALDSGIATVVQRSGEAGLLRTGQARMVVRATAYGVSKADTVTFTITPPLMAKVPVLKRPAGSIFGGDRIIRPNGVVMWLNGLNRPVQVVYDDPTAVLPAPTAFCNTVQFLLTFDFLGGYTGPGSYCTGGNLTLAPPDSANYRRIYLTAQMQQFPLAGTYTYHDAQTGATGRIIVTNEANQ